MHSTTLPVHPTLIDPATGTPLAALAVIGGRPVWPVIGAAEDEPDEDVEDDQSDSPEESDEPDIDEKKKPKQQEPFDGDRFQKALNKKNSENANLRKRLQELEPLAKKAQELEDAGKSESERLTERATSAEERAAKAEQAFMRLEVAVDKGLTPAQARRLVGTTKEELEADADDLLASFATKDKDTKSTRRVPDGPKEKLRGGGDPDEPVEETDPGKLAAAIPRR